MQSVACALLAACPARIQAAHRLTSCPSPASLEDQVWPHGDTGSAGGHAALFFE
jgi:hypothetical protein